MPRLGIPIGQTTPETHGRGLSARKGGRGPPLNPLRPWVLPWGDSNGQWPERARRMSTKLVSTPPPKEVGAGHPLPQELNTKEKGSPRSQSGDSLRKP